MPLSEPMRAGLVVGVMVVIVGVIVGIGLAIIANAIGTLTSAVKAEAIGTYACFRGFAGGMAS